MKRLEQLYNYPKYVQPFRRGSLYFFSKNDGLQNQNVFYVQTGLEGATGIMLDPNKFSADGTSRLHCADGFEGWTYCAYAVSTGRSGLGRGACNGGGHAKNAWQMI